METRSDFLKSEYETERILHMRIWQKRSTCVQVVLRQDERAGALRREGGVRSGLLEGAARAGGLGLRMRPGGAAAARVEQRGRRPRRRFGDFVLRDLVLCVRVLLLRLSPGQLGTGAVRSALSDPVELQDLR